MEDELKINYLVGKGGDRKLKRNVPKDVMKLAGKTAWVQRVGNLNAQQIKEKANLFAVVTDREIQRLRGMLHSSESTITGPELVAFLTAPVVDNLAQKYFRQEYADLFDGGPILGAQNDTSFYDLVDTAIVDLQSAQEAAKGEPSYTDTRVIKFLKLQGLLPEKLEPSAELLGSLWDHAQFQRLCRLVERADMELYRIRYETLISNAVPPINDDFFQGVAIPQNAAADLGKTIVDLTEGFRSSKEGDVSTSRLAQFELPIRALHEHFGTAKSLAQIERDECRQIAEFLPQIPPYVAHHYKGKSLVQAAEAYALARGVGANRRSEAAKHLQVLIQMFDFAIGEGWIDKNPFSGIKISLSADQKKKYIGKQATYEPFTVEELNAIFSDSKYLEGAAQKDHAFWAPLLALWTGMRMNEILQLERCDIKHTDNGIYYFAVTDEVGGSYTDHGFDKTLKTKNSLRDVPVHPFLEKIGFLDFVLTVKTDWPAAGFSDTRLS